MYVVEKEFSFEAAHQLLPGCFSKECSDCIHGHSYKCRISLQASCLDENGMVVDFGRLREFIDEIRAEFDHALLLPVEIAKTYARRKDLKRVMICQFNPTAECLARHIFTRLRCFVNGTELVSRGVEVFQVTVNETTTCGASYCEME